MSKIETLISLVVEARAEDTETCNIMKQAELKWKEANRILSERLKVLNSYVEQQTHGLDQ